jgi:hypothetical protein
MKIATWNIERLKHATKLVRMRMEIEKQDADVLVLTEADTRLQLPSYPFRVETESLEAPFYRESERRVIRFSEQIPCTFLNQKHMKLFYLLIPR